MHATLDFAPFDEDDNLSLLIYYSANEMMIMFNTRILGFSLMVLTSLN